MLIDMKKILIVIGDAGGGHIACANAIKSALLRKDSSLEISTVDLFKLSKFTQNYDYFYYLVSRYRLVEKIFNIGYWLINSSRVFSSISSFFNTVFLVKPSLKYIKGYNPDLIICNNGPTAKVLHLCRKKLDFKYVITVPDLLSVSRWWADSRADLIFCPTLEVENILMGYCKGCKCISPYYPLRHIKEYTKREIEQLKRDIFSEYSFKENIPTILITGCGLATREIVKNLISFIKFSGYQFIILTGRDERLKKDLLSKFEGMGNVVVNGYTNSILDLFAVSDLVIAKPGPATLLEIERVGKKAIFTRPVGYQEWGNVDYLLKNPNFRYVGSKYSLMEKEIGGLLGKQVQPYVSPIKGSDELVEYMFKYLS